MDSVPQQSPNAAPTLGKGRYAKAVWDYEAIEDNEISFKAGDLLEITEMCNDDWFEGKLGDREGFFPANRVQVVDSLEAAELIPTAANPRPSTTTGCLPAPVVPSQTARDTTSNTADTSSDPPKRASTIIKTSPTTSSPSIPSPSPASIAAKRNSQASQRSIQSPQSAAANVSYDVRQVEEPASEPLDSLDSAEVDPFQDPTGDTADLSATTEDHSDSSDAVLVQHEDVDEVPDLDAEDELDSLDDWRTVTNADGTIYYWNVSTGETTWELPPDLEIIPEGETDEFAPEAPGMDAALSYEFDTTYYTDGDMLETRHQPRSSVGSEEMLGTSSPNQTMLSTAMDEEVKVDDDLASQIEYVPPEIIRLEGFISLKKVKEPGGKEPKKSGWHSFWGIVCVGFLVLYKDEPAKLRKKSDKIYPILVIRLNCLILEQASKEQAKKKGAILMSLDDGSQWLVCPQNEGDVNGWMDTVKEASRDRSTVNEYENASSKLFSTPYIDDGAGSKKSKEEGKEATRKITGGKKMDRSGSADLIAEDEGSNKKNVKTKLGAFFSKRPPVNALKEKGIMVEDAPIEPHTVFGGILESQLAKEGRQIPLVVEQSIAEVEKRGLQSQGIYRLSGNAATIQKIKAQFNAGETVQLDDDALDINVVSGALKLYFRELQYPLIPYEYYDRFIDAAKIHTYDDRLIEIKSLVHALPKCNYDVLEFVMRHLCRVADESEVNKMEPPNLAIVFGPTLIRMPDEGQAAYLNMMNMAFHNGLVEAIIKQTEVSYR
ncbi:Rho GTPase-activating protein 27 [Rhizophlyctis rosea]|uniref:Rho GTPase-activating protein 27 n=1 Tax=Rhizophlyctis rosea TaxID=64517 RepID=A0AAD5X7Q2_9FUNG|nr:Rho GTPase-activating protein 27 [Rhizophlyctis rosea]